MTVPGGVQDQTAVGLARGKLRSSSQILPTAHIKSWYLDQFYLTPLTQSLVPPLSKKMYVFTRDLQRLIADLRATGDEVAVIQRYGDALDSKCEVCRDSLSYFGVDLLMYLQVFKSVGKAGKNEAGGQSGRTCSGPRQTDRTVRHHAPRATPHTSYEFAHLPDLESWKGWLMRGGGKRFRPTNRIT